MDEYIERNALIRQIICDMAEFVGTPNEVLKHDERCNYAIFYLKNASIADVVPVVRCRDCKYYKPQKKSAHWENRANYCNRVVTIKTQPDDFCSYGKRKED